MNPLTQELYNEHIHIRSKQKSAFREAVTEVYNPWREQRLMSAWLQAESGEGEWTCVGERWPFSLHRWHAYGYVCSIFSLFNCCISIYSFPPRSYTNLIPLSGTSHWHCKNETVRYINPYGLQANKTIGLSVERIAHCPLL